MVATAESRTDVDALAKRLLAVFPDLDETSRRLALALYRELAQGAAVSPAVLAARSGMPVEQVIQQLQSWPGVYYDGEQRVIGFWGLTIAAMSHRLRIAGRDLYAWCAWDTLFLPELVDAKIDVQSACRASGHPVRLTVTPNGLKSASPAGMVLSFLLPDAKAVNKNVITSFCHYVHFFRSREAARPWLAERPETFQLSLAEAHELGRRINRARYGDLLG